MNLGLLSQFYQVSDKIVNMFFSIFLPEILASFSKHFIAFFQSETFLSQVLTAQQ